MNASSSTQRHIDFHSPTPYYHQLAEILREEIDGGRWSVGELIPAEGALTKMFGISRSVTRKALELLEDEGRVIRIKGKGTLVVPPKFGYQGVNAAGRWFSQRTQSTRLGRVLSSGRIPAGGNLAQLLDIAPREDVWEIVFTHEVGGAPASLSQMYLLVRGTLTVGAPPEFDSGGPDILQQLATRYGVEVVDSQLEIEVVAASEFEATHLDLDPSTPLIQVSSLDSAATRQVGFTRTVVRTDLFYFAIDMQRRTDTARRPLSEVLTRGNA